LTTYASGANSNDEIASVTSFPRNDILHLQ